LLLISFSPSLPPSQAEAVTGDAYKMFTANGFFCQSESQPSHKPQLATPNYSILTPFRQINIASDPIQIAFKLIVTFDDTS
jgi:hypothetical protein